MKKLLKIILVSISSMTLIGIIIIFGILLKYRAEIGDVEKLVEDYKPARPTIIYDRNNEVIDVFYTESRDIANIEEIPKDLQNAFLAIEDKQFYSHNGIHLKRFVGAMVANLKRGKLSQGGSSITQQLAKNAFLSSEKKISRKIKELIIAFEIERTYTKDEILEKYLNEIYFGSGSYGVKAAAKEFFKKDVSEISLAEAALLAGIPNRPTKYNPVRHLENSLKRQKIILNEMHRDGRITDEQYEKALEQKFIVDNEELYKENEEDEKSKNNKLKQTSKKDKKLAADLKDTSIIYKRDKSRFYTNPELTEMVEEVLEEIFSEDKVYTGGFKVYTTFDLKHQKIAKETFENYNFIKNNKSINGAMVTVDPFTGGVISMVGGKNFKAKNFNRAIMAKRQFGSSFKPFLYLSALSHGLEPYSVITDNFISYGRWEPKNYAGRYSGNTTLVNAMNLSINIPAIKTLDKIGVKNFKKEIKDLKYTGEIADLTASLGSMEGTPLNLAVDFSIFVNGGNLIEPNVIREVRNEKDVLIYVPEIKSEKIYDSVDTSAITAMLKTVVSNGTASNAIVHDKLGQAIEQGGKTGTTNENRTIWFTGITPEYVTVCYIGKDNNKPMIGRITGGGIVAPLWARYYQTLINKDLYVPTKFKYLEHHLENGDLVKENLDIYTGLIDGDRSKEIITRKGRMQVESAEKYKNGIATVFGLDEGIYGSSSGYSYETSENQSPQNFGSNNSNSQVDTKAKEDDLLNRLLGE